MSERAGGAGPGTTGSLLDWDVLVLGSANVDLVIDIAELPRPGQTLLARSASRGPGGKGANQAVAAARSGARTSFVAAFGDDADGTALRAVLTDAGLHLGYSQRSDTPTGMAVVLLQDGGENSIVVVPGANATLLPPSALARAAILLAQLEVPMNTVIAAARIARSNGTMVMLNAAPFQALPANLIDNVDFLVVNLQEAQELAAQLGGTTHVRDAPDPDALLSALVHHFPQVIITYGADGSAYADDAGVREFVAAPAVTAVDTTGAGDTYCGVLAAALAQDRAAGMHRSAHTAGRHRAAVIAGMHRAAAAAALCVQRSGAIAAIPTGDEMDAALAATEKEST